MLFRENPCGERVDRIRLQDGHDALQDDRPSIELGRHEMHGHAGNLDTVFEGLSLRVHAWKRRQERWMDIDDAIGKGSDHLGAQHAHEPGEAHHIHAALLKLPYQRAVVIIARGPTAMTYADGFDTRASCPLEAACSLAIGDHNRQIGVEAPFTHRIDQRLKIAAATGNEHSQSTARDGSRAHCTYVTDGSPGTISPMMFPPRA